MRVLLVILLLASGPVLAQTTILQDVLDDIIYGGDAPKVEAEAIPLMDVIDDWNEYVRDERRHREHLEALEKHHSEQYEETYYE